MSIPTYLEHSGRLLYAMAAIDGDPAQREVDKVHREIFRLTSADAQEGGGPGWLLAKLSFDRAVGTAVRPSVILREFESYAGGQGFHHVPRVFRRALWNLLREMAASEHGFVDTEAGMLNRIHGILKPELS
jgi:hypothetical protein